MSQAKVDKYKKNKANRQKIMKKEKWMHTLEMTVIALVCVAFVGWVGYSIYAKAEASKDPVNVVFDNSAVTEYTTNLASGADAE